MWITRSTLDYASILYTLDNSLELTTVSDLDTLRSLTALRAHGLDCLDNVHALDNLSEYDVLSIQPRAGNSANEELGSVGVGTSIGHGKNTRASVLVDEVLILELHAINALSSSSITIGEITTLEHELGNDSVEDASLEMQGLSALASTLLSSAKSSEVFSSLWYRISVQLHDDTASGLIVQGDIEENLGVRHCV